ncbi:DUF3862 domain-containing protein [Rossellomorea sp. AcN35-11]|nr:DUF3862 domain-containing protein [Rossellomorea aquimaris]WJV29799.1 DUF3862 domain-containing protein [Rossellomorea sp. AcN35-11]
MRWNKAVISFAVLLLVSAGILSGCRIGGQGNVQGEEESTLVTLEQYHQLEKGMSYEQVTDILGSPGNAMTDEQDDSDKETYAWDGKQAKSFLSVSFTKGKLISKVQNGLQ